MRLPVGAPLGLKTNGETSALNGLLMVAAYSRKYFKTATTPLLFFHGIIAYFKAAMSYSPCLTKKQQHTVAKKKKKDVGIHILKGVIS